MFFCFLVGFFSVSKLDYPKSDKQTNQRGKKKLSEAYTFMSQGNVKHWYSDIIFNKNLENI